MLAGFKVENNRPYENMRLHDIAKERGTDLYNTVFDPKTVRNCASLQEPHRFSEGIEYVLIKLKE